MLSDDTLEQYKAEIDDEEAIEDTVRRLRDDGLSRLEAIRVLLSVLDVSLREAKEVLLTSDTWAEARQGTRSSTTSTSPTTPPPAPG